jgi:hypothetical protein
MMKIGKQTEWNPIRDERVIERKRTFFNETKPCNTSRKENMKPI